MALAPARRAYYPGSAERYRALVDGRAALRRASAAAGDVVPFTLVEGLDPSSEDPAFASEFFCGAMCETSVAGEDPVEFLERAVDFANERLWGTLTAHLVVHPRTLSDPALRKAVDRAIRRLRYGSVTVNSWAAWAFAAGTVPWGAFPGATLEDVQSGRGFVHNTRMLEGVEKSVVWHPATHFLKPPFFPSHRTTHVMGRSLVDLEAGKSVLALPRLLAAAARA
jgi:aldehyde dehydrogenase (NAD(P)+)